MSKLPVLSIIKAAARQCWALRRRLLMAMAATSLLMSVVDLLLASPVQEIGGLYAAFVLHAISVVLFTLFAVSGHRIILLGGAAVPKYGVYQWSMRETRFLVWLLSGYLIYVCMTVLTGFMSGLSQQSLEEDLAGRLLWYLIFVPGLYVLARLFLLLPALALGKQIDLAWAWRASAGNGWRLALATSAVPVLVAVVWYLVPEYDNRYIDFAASLAVYLIGALDIAILSLSYRHLAGEGDMLRA